MDEAIQKFLVQVKTPGAEGKAPIVKFILKKGDNMCSFHILNGMLDAASVECVKKDVSLTSKEHRRLERGTVHTRDANN